MSAVISVGLIAMKSVGVMRSSSHSIVGFHKRSSGLFLEAVFTRTNNRFPQGSNENMGLPFLRDMILPPDRWRASRQDGALRADAPERHSSCAIL
jgi:hypothetical protein